MTIATLSRSRAAYATALLMAVNVVNYIDRMILAVLVQPIKAELGLSDSQVGLLSGFAFVAIYAAVGLPIAWLADRVGRRGVLAGCIAVWSVCCAACGASRSFAALVAARLGVGIGEAGCMPSSHALLAEIYPEGHRALPIAAVTTGAAIGIAAGLGIGGWAAAAYGWRAAFLIAGVPGIPLAIVLLLTLPEPARIRADSAPVAISKSIRDLFRVRTYRWITLAHPFYLFSTTGVLGWLPAFYMRSHHMPIQQVGSLFGLTTGFGLAGGTLLGAYALQRFTRYDTARSLHFAAWLTFSAYPFLVAALVVPNAWASLTLMMLFTALMGSALSPLIAGQQGVIPSNGRALASALSMFISSYIGGGLGPLLIGIGSESLSAKFGGDALRATLLIASTAIILLGLFVARASRSFPAEVTVEEASHPGHSGQTISNP
jgi:MFS transporter, Spinster family, sphingosine-1-phosphate transporter